MKKFSKVLVTMYLCIILIHALSVIYNYFKVSYESTNNTVVETTINHHYYVMDCVVADVEGTTVTIEGNGNYWIVETDKLSVNEKFSILVDDNGTSNITDDILNTNDIVKTNQDF